MWWKSCFCWLGSPHTSRECTPTWVNKFSPIRIMTVMYHKTTGELVGYVHLDGINNHLAQLERSCWDPAASFSQLELGTKMLCFMVRGLFIHLQFPYAALPCSVISGNTLSLSCGKQLGDWEGHEFEVLALVADGASPNLSFSNWTVNWRKAATLLCTKWPNPYSKE